MNDKRKALEAYHRAVAKLTGYGENNLSWMQVIEEALTSGGWRSVGEGVSMINQQDITFCGSDCTNKECRRHPDRVYPKDAIRSFADFTKHCPDYKKPIETNDGGLE